MLVHVAHSQRLFMTVYFVSRHEGAQRWARILQKQGNWPHPIDVYVEHLEVQLLAKGDVVIGTMPLRDVAAIRRRGAEFLSLDLQVPPHLRGQELTATQMGACSATLTSYRLTEKETFDVHAVRKAPKAAKISPAVTVMLVSNELMPQYLGFAHAPTPTVLLAVTPGMIARGQALEALLKVAPEPPSKVQRMQLKDHEGYASLLQQSEELLDKLLGDGAQSINLNLTGGTKLMSMAFAEAGQAALRMREAVQLEYVNTQYGRIERIRGRQSSALPMQALLGVREAVLASGKADAGCASTSTLFKQQMQRTALHDQLLDDRPDIIGALNSMGMEMGSLRDGQKLKDSWWFDVAACRAKECVFALLESKKFLNTTLCDKLEGKLGRQLHALGVLVMPPSKRNGRLMLQLARPSEIDYLKGGWLEAHVASIIKTAAADDWACGVQVGAERGKNNEIDAIVTCGNRTLLVEVKTANLSRESLQSDGEASSKAQDTLYKLDSIGHDLARNFNTNWLVSARALSGVDVERAQDKRIRVFAPKQNSAPAREAVKQFTQDLRDWISESRASAAPAAGHRFSPLGVSADWCSKEKKDGSAARAAPQQVGAKSSKHAPARGGLNDDAMLALVALKSSLKGTTQP